jgi:hypothetical protein
LRATGALSVLHANFVATSVTHSQPSSERMTASDQPMPVQPDEAHERDPRVHPFGIFSADDMGIGMFQWYRDGREALQSYVRCDLLEHWLAGSDEESRAASAVLARAEAEGLALSDVIEPLNEACGGESNIRWAGSFTELTAGNSEFVRDIRSAWWGERLEARAEDDEATEEELERPIPADAIEEFVEFLARYGY